MDNPELKERTKSFARRTLALSRAIPGDSVSQIIARQLVRCGTSVGANYRAACLAKSRADFINKLRICIEEVDETAYWIELLAEEQLVKESLVTPLHQEAGELLAIFLASIKTASKNRNA
ncbi:MAG: four helix bundle protein [Verrucomicrobiales bacterium]